MLRLWPWWLLGLLLGFLQNVSIASTITEEMISKEVPHSLGEVGLHGAKAVTLAGEDEHVEAFVGFHQGIDETHGVGGVNVVIDLAMH